MDQPTFVAFPAHALLIVEERLRVVEEQGVRPPPGVDRILPLRILGLGPNRAGVR